MKADQDTGMNAKTRKPTGLRYREDQGRFWWELRAWDYYNVLEQKKIIYQELTWRGRVTDFQSKQSRNFSSQYSLHARYY